MAKKTVKIQATYIFTIEIDESSNIVNEYESRKELYDDLVSYRFQPVLPVIGNGVEVKDVEVEECEVLF